MIIINSKEFREQQKKYFDQVDAGVDVLIKRGKDKSYRIVPVTENDVVISKDYILEPDEDLERAMSFDEFRDKAIAYIENLTP